MLCEPEAERATEAYGRWISKVETFLLSEADIAPSSRRASAFKGRAETPKLAKKRLEASPIPAKDLQVAAGYGYTARALATLKEALVKMESYGPPNGQADRPYSEREKRSRN